MRYNVGSDNEKGNPMKEYILVSACLLGENCKYSGGSNHNPEVITYLEETGAEILPICPEVMGGLPTPRTPAEIRGGSVITKDGRDVTGEFEAGAEEAVKLAKKYGCRRAVLKERSPSCGSGAVYDGTFTGRLISGEGVTARRLKALGVEITGENALPR